MKKGDMAMKIFCFMKQFDLFGISDDDFVRTPVDRIIRGFVRYAEDLLADEEGRELLEATGLTDEAVNLINEIKNGV